VCKHFRDIHISKGKDYVPIPVPVFTKQMYAYLAEFLGSLFFVYILLSTGNPLAIGAALALVLLVTFRISPVAINPVVTITMAAAGKIPPSEIIPYCVVQILGGLVALEIYKRYSM